jgi:hypothetical protein
MDCPKCGAKVNMVNDAFALKTVGCCRTCVDHDARIYTEFHQAVRVADRFDYTSRLYQERRVKRSNR